MNIKKNSWLLKSEPSSWSWNNQIKENTTMWDGVRNYQARNNLIKMKKGDLCFFYHSVSEKSIVGIVEIVKESYPDPTDSSGKFVVVEVKTKSNLYWLMLPIFMVLAFLSMQVPSSYINIIIIIFFPKISSVCKIPKRFV